jgi:hypothetical protein
MGDVRRWDGMVVKKVSLNWIKAARQNDWLPGPSSSKAVAQVAQSGNWELETAS